MKVESFYFFNATLSIRDSIMNSSLNKRYLIKLLSNVVSGVVNIAIMAIVPQTLGPTAFGQFSYLQQFFSQVLAFLDAGTSTAFFTKLSANQGRRELVSYYAVISLLLLLLLCFLVYLIDITSLHVVVISDIPIQLIYLGMIFGYLTWLSQIFIKVSDAHALTVSVELVRIVHKLIFLGLLFLYLSFYSFDIEGYFYYNYMALWTFVTALVFIFYRSGVFDSEIFSSKINFFPLTSEFYKFASPLFVFNVVGITVSLFDIWLLQYVNGSEETGFYGLAYSIAAICFIFTSAMTPVITREFSKYYSTNEIDKVVALFNKYVPGLYSLSAFFSIFIAFNAGFILEFFTDSRFNDAMLALIFMAFYPMHQTYGQITGAVFFAAEQTGKYKNISVIFSVIGLVLSIVLLYFFELGAEGLALKMVLIQVFSVNVQLYYNSLILGFKAGKLFIHQILSLIFFSIIMYCVQAIDIHLDNTLYQVLTEGVIYFFIVLILSIVFPFIFMTDDLTKWIFKHVRSRTVGN